MPKVLHHYLAGFPKSISPSCHAAEVNGFVYLTGQLGRDLDNPEAPLPDGIKAQTEVALRNMSRVLAALDLDFSNVVSMRVYLSDFERDYDDMNVVYGRLVPGNTRPARTCVGVTAMARGALIEIDCVAARA
ncbi:RidA family protein [Azospirillum brasilense]|nr:RidA family protein [Azospirillum brasilense]